MSYNLGVLIGKTIKEVILYREKFNEAITFRISHDEDIHFVCEADCCSETWIESVEGIENILGEEILRIEEKNIEINSTNYPNHECLDIYNVDIKTKKGCCTIDFRNSSNGYYGGRLERYEGPVCESWK